MNPEVKQALEKLNEKIQKLLQLYRTEVEAHENARRTIEQLTAELAKYRGTTSDKPSGWN